MSSRRRVFPPPSDALSVAALLEREEQLIERARRLKGAHRRVIEEELTEIRRLLEALGLRKKDVS